MSVPLNPGDSVRLVGNLKTKTTQLVSCCTGNFLSLPPRDKEFCSKHHDLGAQAFLNLFGI
jgi:hypothetical protein